MNKTRKLLFLFLGASLYFFFSKGIVFSQEKHLFVKQIKDTTFYDHFCFQDNWLWLCQAETFSLPALKEKDNWFYFSQGFFAGQNSQENIIVVFESLPQELIVEDLFLDIDLKSVTDSIGMVKLWFDWGQGWQAFGNYPEEAWLIFGEPGQDKRLDLGAIFSELVLSPTNLPWSLKIEVVPLISSQPIMLAIDRVSIEATSFLSEPTPTLTPTPPQTTITPLPSPTPTPSPLPKESFLEAEFSLPKSNGKIYFDKAVDLAINILGNDLLAKKIIFQYSSDKETWQDIIQKEANQQNFWQHRWYPSKEGLFYLRAKIYDQEDNFILVNHSDQFIFDQTSPVVSWKNPVEADNFESPLTPKVVVEDFLAGVEEEVQFFYRYQDEAWQEIKDFPWYFSDNLPLGDYWLRAQVSDRAGNQAKTEIALKRKVRIFDIFLVGDTLSWQTSHPVISRVVYDYQSLSAGGINDSLPNLGYTWASDQLSKQEETSHQYTLPSLPPGEYFYRVLALETQTNYSPEFSFKTENFLSSQKESGPILGETTVAETAGESGLLPTVFESDPEEIPQKTNFNWPRLVVVFVLALSFGGLIIYYQLRQNKYRK